MHYRIYAIKQSKQDYHIQEKTLYLACNDERSFFSSDVYKIFVNPLFIFWIFFIRFGTKVYRQTIDIAILLLLQICFYFVMRELS